MDHKASQSSSAGFSLLELLIAMALTITMLGIAATALSSGYRIRAREKSVTDAVADAQRALNIMSREIANAGFNLSTNGIVPGDSDGTSIRIRSNLNKYEADASVESRTGVIDEGEDLKFFINPAFKTNYLVRHDEYSKKLMKTTVLANRMDSLFVHYFGSKVTYSTENCDIKDWSSDEVSPGLASYVVIALCVQLPEQGNKGTPGYQPASNVLLVSDVTLRNSNLIHY